MTKQVIEVQKRMEELIQATDRVSERLGGAAGLLVVQCCNEPLHTADQPP